MKSLSRLLLAVVVCFVATVDGAVSAQTLTTALVSPAEGATDVATNVTFTWSTVPGAQAYYLYVGTTPGTHDIINTGEVQSTSYSGASLPGGELLFARMWVKAGEAWHYVDSTFATASAATLTAPATGATNVSPVVLFRWTAVQSAAAYKLWVGTAPGLHDIVNTTQLQQASYQSPASLPGGELLYARLWTEIGTVWTSVDSTFTTSPAASLISPANGSSIVIPRPTFTWTTVAGAQAYYLYVGTTLGAKDLVNTGEIQSTSYLAKAALPTDVVLYARLWTKAAGAWIPVDTTFTVEGVSSLTSPANGATNVAPSVTFTWSTIAGAQAYYLYVGTAVGAHDIINTGEVQTTSYSRTALPPGQLLFARMWVKVNGAWRYVDSTFTTASIASLTSPANGSVGISRLPAFAWTAVPGAQVYYLYVGTALGAKDLVNTGEIQSTTYLPKAPLPTDVVLYARLWTKWGGVWQSVDTTFTIQAVAFLTTPADGAINVDPNIRFTWSTVAGAEAYYLYVGTQRGTHDIVNTGEVQVTSFVAAPLPLGQLFFARMWVKVGGAWRYVDSQFTTVQVAQILWPVTGPLNMNPDATFTWTATSSAQAYRLSIGTIPGGSDVLDSGETAGTSYPSANLPGGVTLYARIATKANGAWFPVDTTFTAAAILDDFSSPQIRETTSGQYLWSHYDEGAPGTVSLDVGTIEETTLLGNGATNGGGAYLQFVPKTNDSYAFPAGYAQHYLESGTWNSNYNRLTFRMKVNRSVPGTAADHMFEVGTYIRWRGQPDIGWQGSHYYHFLAPNVYADQWIYVTLNRVPQHQVGQDPNTNWPENPTGDPYFDDLTRFYVDDVNAQLLNTEISYDDFTFSRVDNEPDTLVSNTTAQYSGTQYEVSWNTPKWVNQRYDICYSTTSMKQNGFMSGIYGGSIVSQGAAYTTVRWYSPTMAQAPGGLFIAIRPVGQTQFTELFVPSN